MGIIRTVVLQHAADAAMLWLRRDSAIGHPHYRLVDLATLDRTVDANLDGLRIAGELGWAICEEELGWEEAGEVFVAAVQALDYGKACRLDRVMSIASSSKDLLRPVVSALGWLSWERAFGCVKPLLNTRNAAWRHIAIAAAAVHRQDPGKVLATAIEDADPLLRARSLRAAGELGRLDLLPAVREHLDEDVAGCRLASAWTVALMAGDAKAVDVLQQIVEFGEEDSARALQMAVRRMPRTEGKAWIAKLAARPERVRWAVIGAGLLGLPGAVPWLFDRMQMPELARVAGEALSMITGVDIALEDLESEWPEGFTAGPTEDPEDENVEMDPDENLPWPDREKIAAWWQRNSGRFEPGARHLVGRPLAEDWLQEVLRHGNQRQRAAAALGLAIRRPGQPLFEVRSPGWRQQQLLGMKIHH